MERNQKGGRFFRIRHEKVHTVFPGERLTMTSYTVGNKTSLSWKPCIVDKKLLYGSLSGSHSRSFRIRHEKSPPGG